eukprot:gene998-1402_t
MRSLGLNVELVEGMGAAVGDGAGGQLLPAQDRRHAPRGAVSGRTHARS